MEISNYYKVDIKTINVIGLGYVGLPAAIKFSNSGYKVFGTDLNKDLLENLKNGILSFNEVGMEKELKFALKNGLELSSSCVTADMYIVAVPTHFNKESKKIDPYHLISAVKSIVENCNSRAIIVIESTVSPGTIDEFLVPLGKEKNIVFAHAPERIIPGRTLYEITHNDRVIGSDDKEICQHIKEAYQSFCEGNILTTNLRTAELTKVVENTYRDINIAYANELKKICQKMSIDVHEVIQLANRHPRVNILNPSAGVGGHCISVDPWFLVGDFPQEAQLIARARIINDSMPSYTWNKFIKQVKSSKIGIYGLTYKPNIDDVRESPAFQLLEYLKSTDPTRELTLYDPYLKEQVSIFQTMEFDKFLDSVEAILVMSPHDHLQPYLENIQKKNIAVFDPFNTYDSNVIKI